MSGILVIRGGAIGDFLLTLPAIRLLREAFPETRLEILGYKHIIALAEGRYYAHATRSIEYSGLASFFTAGAKLPEDLTRYFSSFGQVISYLYDPDGHFEENLRRAGVKNYLPAYSKIGAGIGGEPQADVTHAARRLAQPLERLALFLEEDAEAIAAPLHLSPEDHAAADALLAPLKGIPAERTGTRQRPIVALHPGSGGSHKLWPLEHWSALVDKIAAHPLRPGIVLIGGEADTARLEKLASVGGGERRIVIFNRPLPEVAAVIARSDIFIGHDSGISHIAAAAGTRSILLFGPTDPRVWAPGGSHVTVVTGRERTSLETLEPETILALLWNS